MTGTALEAGPDWIRVSGGRPAMPPARGRRWRRIDETAGNSIPE